MADKSIIIDTPDGIQYARMCALKGALSLECKGMKLSRGRSAYAIVKREFGFRGNKQRVLEQLQEAILKRWFPGAV